MSKDIKLAEELSCTRCEHIWKPRQNDVRVCPKCKTPYWDLPRGKDEAI